MIGEICCKLLYLSACACMVSVCVHVCVHVCIMHAAAIFCASLNVQVPPHHLSSPPLSLTSIAISEEAVEAALF